MKCVSQTLMYMLITVRPSLREKYGECHMVAAGQCSVRVPQDDLNSDVPSSTSNVLLELHFWKIKLVNPYCYHYCLFLLFLVHLMREGVPWQGRLSIYQTLPRTMFSSETLPPYLQLCPCTTLSILSFLNKLTLPYISPSKVIIKSVSLSCY